MAKTTLLNAALFASTPIIIIGCYILLPTIAFGAIFTSAIIAASIFILTHAFGNSKNLPLFFLLGIPTVYYGMGILPLSIRRDDFDPAFWWICLATLNFGIMAGWIFSKYIIQSIYKNIFVKNTRAILLIIKILHVIGVATAIIVFLKFGFIALNPTRRFEVSSFYLYAIEVLITTSIMMLAIYEDRNSLSSKNLLFFVVISLVALSMTGYRSQMALLIVGLIIYLVLKQISTESNRKPGSFAKIVSISFFLLLCLLSLGYYMRVELTGLGILDWGQRIIELEISNAEYMLPLLPIHESARENIGVTSIALQRISEIESIVPLYSFMWIELLTIFPGFSQTATGILGQVVNRSTTDFLTPGIIGGTYLSHGMAGVFLIGFILAMFCGIFWRLAMNTKSHLYTAITAIFFVYFIHFMYRGIARPMYMIVGILVLFSIIYTIKRGRQNK